MNLELPDLNFPGYQLSVKIIQKRAHVFDPVRKKFVLLSPEEWVRQHCLRYLLETKGFPPHRLQVEKEVSVHGLCRRFDLLVTSREGLARILVECKAPSVVMDQRVLDQLSRYNITLGAPYLWATNGREHYMYRIATGTAGHEILTDLPQYHPEF